ncbi:MAG TPA: rRNA maturation RNase YbeY [Planctomycetaceae bacterium]|nr:rRNA maturation RNase YbeY [Planctomycetaceae bacterium]
MPEVFPHLSIDNRQSLPVAESTLVEQLTAALQQEQVASAEVAIAFVDDAEIRRINREFLDHDWPTDIISFSYADDESTVTNPAQPRGCGRELDGELVVSVETAARCAAAHGWSLHAELLLYCVHGLLHLCGYDDLTDDERPLMRRRERELLAAFGLSPQNLEE